MTVDFKDGVGTLVKVNPAYTKRTLLSCLRLKRTPWQVARALVGQSAPVLLPPNHGLSGDDVTITFGGITWIDLDTSKGLRLVEIEVTKIKKVEDEP